MPKRDLKVVEVQKNKMYAVYEGKNMLPIYTVKRNGDGMWQTYLMSGSKYGRPNMYRNDLFESLKCGVMP